MTRKSFIFTLLLTFMFLSQAVVVPAQDEDRKIIAGIDFDPQADGYSFRNYGGDHDGSEDLSAADLVRLMANAIEGSWASPDQKRKFLKQIDDYFANWLAETRSKAALPGSASERNGQVSAENAR
jgi:hypothetical protein